MTNLRSASQSLMDQMFQEKPEMKSTSSWAENSMDYAPKQKQKGLTKEVDFEEKTDDENKTDVEDGQDGDDEDEDGETSPFEEEEMHEGSEDETERESESSFGSASTVYTKLSPFTIRWAFGVNTAVKVINLTTEKAAEIFYVSSHFGVIFNYRLNRMEFLPGHNYPIQSISADSSGRWLVTADCGEDSVIIIWDSRKRIPVWTLYNVFPGGVKYVKISYDGRFLAAINCHDSNMVKFWRWTLGREQPDGTIELDTAWGQARHIAFNRRMTEQFIITMRYKIMFCEYTTDRELKKHPAFFEFQNKKVGTFRESLFLDDGHTSITSTNTGYLIVWCDVKFSEPIPKNTQGTIYKNHIKSLRIHKMGITCMRLCDSFLVTSAEDGQIYFHDQCLRMMYLIPTLKFDPLVSVSFNLANHTVDPFLSDNTENAKSTDDQDPETSIKDEERARKFRDKQGDTAPIQKQVLFHGVPFEDKPKQIPSDCTMGMHPFIVRDFVFLTKTGKMGYLSHQRKKIKYFLYKADSPVLTMASNPTKSHVIVSYASGWLVLYNFQIKKVMVTVNMQANKIQCMTFSHMGHLLFAGTEQGNILIMNPVLLTVTFTLYGGRCPIKKICLSKNDLYLACFDQMATVHVFGMQRTGRKKWIEMGKYISHYKPINDILFEQLPESSKTPPRLFTIGQDRMLVEYDTTVLEPNKLKILKTQRIEQTAIPLCLIWHPNFYKSGDFLISNSEYKLKVVDSNTQVCQKTTLGPTADSPIVQMKLIPEPNKPPTSKVAKMIYATEKHMGIKILPATGNPFENIGMVAHPVKIISLVYSHNYRYVFTAGSSDFTVLMWEVNLNAVDVASQIGGSGLEPFLSLIEGGPNSFFFREIEDFFYYAQIIHQGEDPNLDRSVSKTLALCEIPDLFRSLGYYPTDYEIDNIMYELKHLKFHETGEVVTEISFEECVKAFLNHKPVHGISLTNINNALMAIADLSDPTDILVERNELYKALENRAEAMDHKEVQGYLCILLLPKDENNPVPATMSLDDFASNVLGIDLTISEEQVRHITHSFEYKKNETN